MPRLTLRDIQLEELKILKKTVTFLEKNNLTYFLTGGTLLGAIRHNGFIPWDDDIDILIPRKDYEKLIQTLRTAEIDPNFSATAIELNNSFYPFCKIINHKIKLKSETNIDKHLWIDIFPLDTLPDDIHESKKIVKKTRRLMGIIYLHGTPIKAIIKERKSPINRLIKIFLKPLASIIPRKIIARKIRSIITRHCDETTNTAGQVAWPLNYGAIVSNTIFQPIQHVFEGDNFSIPKKYDEYLTSLYGDYMKLPPKDQRVTHSFDAFKTD